MELMFSYFFLSRFLPLISAVYKTTQAKSEKIINCPLIFDNQRKQNTEFIAKLPLCLYLVFFPTLFALFNCFITLSS